MGWLAEGWSEPILGQSTQSPLAEEEGKVTINSDPDKGSQRFYTSGMHLCQSFVNYS